MTSELTKAAQQALREVHMLILPVPAPEMSTLDLAKAVSERATKIAMLLTAALTQRPAAQTEREAFEAWARPNGYDLRTNAILGHYSSIDTLRAWNGWQARASLPAQPAAQATPDVPETDFGKMSTPEPTVTYATVRDAEDELHIECRFSDGQKFAAVTVAQGFDNLAHRIETMLNGAQQATPEPVGEPAFWVLTKQLQQRETTTRGYMWFSNPQNDSWTPVFTRPAPVETELVGEPAMVVEQLRSGAIDVLERTLPIGVHKLYTRPAPGVPEDVLAILDECRSALMECDRDCDYALIDRIDALAAAQAKGAGQ